MAELPHIGNNCQLTSCNKLDFLPFQCSYCQGIFCLEHYVTSSHECVKESQEPSPKKAATLPLLKACSFSGCKQLELLDVICGHCNWQFCLLHRHSQDHACPSAPINQTNSISKIQELNQKYTELAEEGSKSSKGHKSEATANKVRLMRLKMKAIGEKGVPPEDKVFFVVTLPQRCNKKEMDCYFSKHWVVGRMIDWLAKTVKLVNNNHLSSAEQLHLFINQDPLLPLATSLADLIATEKVHTGDCLRLEYSKKQSSS